VTPSQHGSIAFVNPFSAAAKVVIGMVHVQALPGTSRHATSVREIVAHAVREALILKHAGFGAILLENMHDAPYVMGPHGPEITATMTAAALAVRAAVGDLPLGIQVLARGEREALAVALASGCSFIRCENFVFSHVADEGLMVEAAAGPLLRYRKAIGASHIAILCDIKKKHAAHSITADVGIADMVHGAEFFGADGMIITGSATGRSASLDDVAAAAGATDRPVIVGSGVTAANVREMLAAAKGVIVGSSLKQGGVWFNDLDPKACELFIAAAKR
jgi:membrane complex biogenesis BtpA family protein